jgi:P27 family predicted phage terminase small subunit
MPNHRKPTRQKELENTLRPDRMNPNEPKVVCCEPGPPDGITQEALEIWHDVAPLLARLKVIAESDRHTLRLYCEGVAQYNECTRVLEKEGRFYETDTGMIREHPASKRQLATMAQLKAYAAALGLSPADRSRVEALPDPSQADPLEELRNERRSPPAIVTN